MFKIGDKVKNVYEGAKRYGMTGVVVDLNTDEKEVVVEYYNGEIGGGKASSFINLNGSIATKSNMKSVLSRIADAFRSEPEKTYRALGIKDSSGNLTAEGVALLNEKLFAKLEEELIRPEAIALLAEEKKNK